MKITDIETIVLRLPEVLSNGDGLQDTLIIKVHTDEGLVGLGEVHTSPTVAKAVIDAPVSQRTVQGFKQLLIGRDPRQINAIWQSMYESSLTYGRRGIVMNVISGIDIALWDILGKSLGVPIHALLGGAIHDCMPAYASNLSPTDPNVSIELFHQYKEQGFTAAKLGWGALGGDVRSDAQWIAKLRGAIGGQMKILIDMGVSISFEDALYFSRALAESDVYFLEEPLAPDDFVGFRRLVELSPTPIATGEKETTRFGFRDLIDIGGLRIIQPDLARAGGITEILRISAYAELRGARVIPHCWASDILVSATSQFLITRTEKSMMEVNVSENPLRKELFVEPIQVIDGVVRPTSEPGLGLTLNQSTVAKYRVD